MRELCRRLLPGQGGPDHVQRMVRLSVSRAQPLREPASSCLALSDFGASLRSPDGYYCPDSSASPIPLSCPAGTFALGNLTSLESDCQLCPVGHACAGGAAQPSICLAGNVAPANGSVACSKCKGGTYQQEEGQTACVACEPGYFCKVGSPIGLPCPGGTFSNATGLSRAAQCQSVASGFWAPIGSIAPEPCFSGTVSAAT